jgi:predicted cupin superfamily sugar epimerase/quercetin dioxygenase-like cupin family protein
MGRGEEFVVSTKSAKNQPKGDGPHRSRTRSPRETLAGHAPILLFYGIMNPLPLPSGRAGQLVRHHRMSLIPDEGAWFALTYVSPDRVPGPALPERYAGAGDRPLGNAILALVTRRDFSALHRLRTDEIWHFYEGDPLELLLLHADGRDERVLLGCDSLAGQCPQLVVPAGTWMGARPARDEVEAYSFFGCTLAPGFDYSDFEPGWGDELAAAWPARAALIAALTREAFATRPADAAIKETAEQAGTAAAAAVARGRVFTPEAAPELALGPGVTVRELAGRGGVARTEAVSFARFRLEAGRSTGRSRYLGGDEHFVVLSGTGFATLAAGRFSVGPGAVVVIPRGEPHAMTAGADGPLEFLTVLAPAFDPTNYRPEP